MKRRVALALALFGLGACSLPQYRLEHSVTCTGILSVHLGDSESEVSSVIGPPVIRTVYSLLDRQRFGADTAFSYDQRAVEGYESRDRLLLDFVASRLTSVLGQQFTTAAPNPVLAYRLTKDVATGKEQRTVGPAFEQVFTCGPDFSRDRLPAGTVVVK